MEFDATSLKFISLKICDLMNRVNSLTKTISMKYQILLIYAYCQPERQIKDTDIKYTMGPSRKVNQITT